MKLQGKCPPDPVLFSLSSGVTKSYIEPRQPDKDKVGKNLIFQEFSRQTMFCCAPDTLHRFLWNVGLGGMGELYGKLPLMLTVFLAPLFTHVHTRSLVLP